MSQERARTISDAAYRDAALWLIIELCMTANDMKASRILVQTFGPNSRRAPSGVADAIPLIMRSTLPTLILINVSGVQQGQMAEGGME